MMSYLSKALLLLVFIASTTACQITEPMPVLSKLDAFTLTERSKLPLSLESLKGQVWVAQFMFTRCEGPCPRMVAEFKDLQRRVGPMEGVKWVSITADPKYDTPEVLQEYAGRFEADPQNWLFATGSTEEIYKLAEKGFLLPVMPDYEKGGALITHSIKFAVVDQRGQIRAYHDHFESDNAKTLKAELEHLL